MEFSLKTTKREEIIDITERIKKLVDKDGINKNAVLVFVPHTTCSIILNENYDPDVKADILHHLSKQIPSGFGKHSEGNSDAHIKSSLMGQSQTIPIEDGKLLLGRWQGIALAEFDGPRTREVFVRFL